MQKIDSTSGYRPRVGGHEGQTAMKLTKDYQCQWSMQDGDETYQQGLKGSLLLPLGLQATSQSSENGQKKGRKRSPSVSLMLVPDSVSER